MSYQNKPLSPSEFQARAEYQKLAVWEPVLHSQTNQPVVQIVDNTVVRIFVQNGFRRRMWADPTTKGWTRLCKEVQQSWNLKARKEKYLNQGLSKEAKELLQSL